MKGVGGRGRGKVFPGQGPRRPPGVPLHSGLACLVQGLKEEAARPMPGVPVKVGTAGLSSSLHGQSQTQDEVVPSLLSGGLLASLSGVPASVCPSERKAANTNVKHRRPLERMQLKWEQGGEA